MAENPLRESLMERTFLGLGAVFAMVSVAVGAFGAHGLRATLSEADLATFETAARYQMYHALGLVVVAWVYARWPGTLPLLAGWLFVAGIALFSGSLYTLVLTGQRWLGAITPFGGLSFLAGWALLAWTAFRGE
jgi:uncharacterized membrane protein YgdD (TMEM256/DUF423 family)